MLLAGWCFARAMPSIQTIRGEVLDEKNIPIAEAPCTLTSRLLPTDGLTRTTDYKGHFEFTGLQPGTYSLLCAAAGYIPLKRTVEVTDVSPPDLQMILPPQVVMHQTVEVREKADTVGTAPSAPSAKLGNEQLASLPLVEQKFKAALPYLPGVIRTPDGRINIKGVPDSQGQLLVNSAESADPVTGNLAIDVPVVAIDSLQVYKNTYDAQYGGFTGGLTTIHTRPPSQKWEFEVQNIPPNPRIKNGTLVGIADYNPRLYITGPLITNRLSFSESLGYDIDKQPVRGLAWPHNEIWTHDFNSFTDLHYVFSSHHLLTATGNVFPLRRQFADINSLVPLAASSDYGQHGFQITLTDQFITSGGGIFTTMLDGMQFYSWGHGEGGANMLVTPNGWGGNFFNAYQRNSEQEQLSETYKFPRLKWWGKHEWTLGAGFLNRIYNGNSRSRTGEPGAAGRHCHGADRLSWERACWPRGTLKDPLSSPTTGCPTIGLSLDLGLRYAGQTLGRAANIAPPGICLFTRTKWENRFSRRPGPLLWPYPSACRQLHHEPGSPSEFL
jgi:hypothetical protein